MFSGLQKRSAGILLHPTSLPSAQGIGSLGKSARALVDFLAEIEAEWWQVCPLGPTGYGDSPYACFSSFAGNPYLIDLEELVAAGLIGPEAIAPLRELPADHVDYAHLWRRFNPVLHAAFDTARNNPEALHAFGDFTSFKKANGPGWLDDYALFRALKDKYDGAAWNTWPKEARDIRRARLAQHDLPTLARAEFERFVQFLFFAQWGRLRKYAAAKGVKILGDIPIYVAPDSADVWAEPTLFHLDAELAPVEVAGVPPDYFSKTGQLWGNPVYDWKRHRETGYDWWIRRLRANLALYDGVRLDHFRAFHDYWAIPAEAKDAREGRWKDGPGIEFFQAVHKALGDPFIVAEDLGELSPGVTELRRRCGLPGMIILQFAFGSDASNAYLPHNHTTDAVVYPGTHDNNTTCGWSNQEPPIAIDHFRRYFGTDGKAPHWTLMRAAMTSPARLAILPMQDLLGLDSAARFNTPGTAAGNWAWRLTEKQLNEARIWIGPNIRELIELTGRHSESPQPKPPLP